MRWRLVEASNFVNELDLIDSLRWVVVEPWQTARCLVASLTEAGILELPGVEACGCFCLHGQACPLHGCSGVSMGGQDTQVRGGLDAQEEGSARTHWRRRTGGWVSVQTNYKPWWYLLMMSDKSAPLCCSAVGSVSAGIWADAAWP